MTIRASPIPAAPATIERLRLALVDDRVDLHHAAHVAELPVGLGRERVRVVASDAALPGHRIGDRDADGLLAVALLGAGKGRGRIGRQEVPGLLLERVEPAVFAVGERILAEQIDRRGLAGEQVAQVMDHRRRQRNGLGVGLVIERRRDHALLHQFVDDVVGVVGAHGLELGGRLQARADRLVDRAPGDGRRDDRPHQRDGGREGDRNGNDQPPAEGVPEAPPCGLMRYGQRRFSGCVTIARRRTGRLHLLVNDRLKRHGRLNLRVPAQPPCSAWL
jgi:hypothetical protein